MRTMERGRGKILAVALLLTVVFCANVGATTVVYTDKIDLGFLFNTWYLNTGTNPNTGNINFNSTAMNLQSNLTTFTNVGLAE